MANGKLSSQLSANAGTQQQLLTRTRTKRKVLQQDLEKKRSELKTEVESAGNKLSEAKTIDDYEKIYNTLSSNIQPFFKAPSTLREERAQRIQSSISEVQSEIQAKQQKENELKRTHRDRVEQITKSVKDPKDRSRRLDNLDYKLAEDLANIQGQLQGLAEGLNRLKSGEEISTNAIEDYANEKGNYLRERENAKNQNSKMQEEFNAKLQAGIESGGLGTFKNPFVVQEIKDKKVQSVQVLIGGVEVYKTKKPSELAPFQKNLDEQQIQRDLKNSFKSSLQNVKITEPTSTMVKKEKSFLSKVGDVISDVSSALFYKTSIGLAGKTEPTALTTEELNKRRLEIIKLRLFPVTVTPFKDSAGLVKEYQFSKDIRESGKQEIAIQEVQAKAVEEANKNLENISSSYGDTLTVEQSKNYYADILNEAKNLAKVGVRTKYEGNQLVFTSKSFETDLNPATIKLLQKKSTVDQGSEVVGALGTEALEFFSFGVATGEIGSSLKIGTKIEKATEFFKIGKNVVKGAKIVGAGVGTGLIGYQTIKGGIAGYKLGKESGVAIPSALIIGGKPLVEIASFSRGYKLATVGLKTPKLEAQELQLKEYQKEIKRQQLINIRDYGQYSERATFKTNQVGVGKKITPARRNEFALILEREVGLKPKDAKAVLSQASVFEQELQVKNVFKEEFKFKKVGIDVSLSDKELSKQLAFEFKQSGSKISDFTIKTSVSGKDKRYALTQIFKKGRTIYDVGFTESGEITKIPKVRFNLEKVLATKISKFKGINLGEGKKFSVFDYETRLIKSKDVLKGFGKLEYPDVLKVGLEKLDANFIKEKFFGAGKVGKIDIGKGARLELPFFKGSNNLRVAKLEEEFLFKQTSTSKPDIALKNIFKDLKNFELRKASKRTPLSKTFKEDKLVEDIAKKSLGVENIVKEGASKNIVGQGLKTQKVKEVNINALIKDINIKVRGETKAKVSSKNIFATKGYTGQLNRLSLSSSLALFERTKLNSILKENQLEKLGLRVKQESAQGLKQNLRLRQDQLVKQIEVPKLAELTSLPNAIIRSPTIKTPITKTPKIPKLALIIGIGKLKQGGRKRRKGKMKEDPFAFVESFTARALAFKPLVIKENKQNINKLVKEFEQPFAIRRAVIFK